MKRTSIIVELRHIRCGDCKAALLHDVAVACPDCGAVFDSITSNHAGLAAKLERRRQAAAVNHVNQCDARTVDYEMVRS